jgi:hypothetical protein
MFWTRQTEDGVTYRNQKIGGLTFELTRQRRLAHILDDVVAHQTPKLSRCDPEASFVADYFCRMLARHTNTSKLRPKMGISDTERVRFDRTRAVYLNILRLQDHNMICLDDTEPCGILSIFELCSLNCGFGADLIANLQVGKVAPVLACLTLFPLTTKCYSARESPTSFPSQPKHYQ